MTTSPAPWSLPADARCAQVLLDTAAARAIDKAAIAAGTPEIDLMERAGAATVDAIRARWQPCRVLVLTGPGNNGGDGFVAARLLADAGWSVRVAGMKQRDQLSGAAAIAAGRWQGAIETLNPSSLADAELVIDAVFGIGLTRAVDGVVAAVVGALNASQVPVVAVDIASGIDSDSGAVLGVAVEADLTVTFFRRKPGHLLMPGRDQAGEIVVSDLAVGADIYASIPATIFVNEAELWRGAFPWPTASSHKYTRGHAVVLGGTKMTGAARLAAHAAQRAGAGLVTIAADPSVVPLYAAWRADLLVSSVAAPGDFTDLLSDRRLNAVLLGPGAGADARLEAAIGTALDAGVGLVLDADALRLLAEPNGLLARLNARVLLTPHEGEFQRLFGSPSPRVPAALKAAAQTGATVLLKGSDTIVATPDGKVVVNTGAPPDLATAGSGDVLAGLAVGLLANRLSPTLAALIACWLHAQAATAFGPGLIAGDIPDTIPRILTLLRNP